MRVMVAGDFVPQERIAAMVEKGDYSFFGQIKPVVETQADFAVLNFESPVVDTPQAKKIDKCGPNLKCSPNAVKAVRYAGFSAVTLANNHVLDYGEAGLNATLEHLDKEQILHVGVGKDVDDAANVLYYNLIGGGGQLAVVNCCENEFSVATDHSAGANPINAIRQCKAIRAAKEKADFVLVICHGGHEMFSLPSLRMQELYRFFIDCGADAVVNHHQHCYSGFEYYESKPIFYGLGNLCFERAAHRNDIWNYGYMVCLDFGQTISHCLYPYRQCGEHPVVELLSQDAFDDELKRLNGIIADTNLLKQELRKYYSRSSRSISNIFEPIRNRYYLIAKHKGLVPSLIAKSRKLQAENYVCCESHRDKLMFYLKGDL